jgi:hypothetical protein
MAGKVSMDGLWGIPTDEVSALSYLVTAAVTDFKSSWLGTD